MRESAARPPWTAAATPWSDPPMPPESVFEFPMTPTPPVADMPGTRFCRPRAFREDGIAEMMSLVMICCVRALCTSTMGVSPVTVIVSSSAPTLRSAFTVATKFPDSSIPSRRTMLNPGNSNVTAYAPGRRSTMRYCPVASVTTDRTRSIRAGLAASTRTPGRTPPELSLTTPVIAACAEAVDGRSTETRTNRRAHRDRWIGFGIAVLLTGVVEVDERQRAGWCQGEYFTCGSIRVRFVPHEEIDEVFVGGAAAGVEGRRRVDRSNRDRLQIGRGDVGQQKRAGLQHGLDVRHRQRLVEQVVVDEHVCRDHQVEGLPIEALGDDVEVRHRHPPNGSRPRTNAPHLGQLRDRLGRTHLGGRANPIAERLPVRANLGEPRRAPRQRQVQRVADVARGPCVRPCHVIDDPRTDVEERDVRPWRRGKTEPHERVEHGERLERLRGIVVEPDVLVREVEPGADDRHSFDATGFEQPACLHGRQLLLDLLLFARDADHRGKQIPSRGVPVGSGCEAKSSSLKKRSREQPALVVARRRQRRQEIVESGLDQLDGPAQHHVPIARRARFDRAEDRARFRRKRGAEQHPVDDGVFVALVEPRADVAIVTFDPARPCRVHLRRRQRVELGWEPARKLGQNRAGFAETNEPGRRVGGRRGDDANAHTPRVGGPPCGDQQQDGDDPNRRLRNAPILAVFQAYFRKLTNSALMRSAWVQSTPCGPPGSSTNLTFLNIFAWRLDVASGGRMRSASPCRISVGTLFFFMSFRKSSIQQSTHATVPIADAPTPTFQLSSSTRSLTSFPPVTS